MGRIVATIAVLCLSVSGQADAQEVEVRLIGQAEVLEPGIISLPDGNDEYLTFSPDGQTAVFTRRSREGTRLFETHLTDDGWSTPQVVSFSGEFSDNRPAFSPDGSRMWFASNRPEKRGGDRSPVLNIWFVDRLEDGSWGEPRSVGSPINSATNDSHPSVASSGNLYFVRWGETPNDVYVAEWTESGFAEPRMLGPAVNTAESDSHPWIDPEERFLLFTPTDREGGYGGGDIYISYRTESGWTEAQNLGTAINSDYYEYSARIGPPGKLTFSRAGFGEPERRPADIYVIDLEVVSAEP